MKIRAHEATVLPTPIQRHWTTPLESEPTLCSYCALAGDKREQSQTRGA